MYSYHPLHKIQVSQLTHLFPFQQSHFVHNSFIQSSSHSPFIHFLFFLYFPYFVGLQPQQHFYTIRKQWKIPNYNLSTRNNSKRSKIKLLLWNIKSSFMTASLNSVSSSRSSCCLWIECLRYADIVHGPFFLFIHFSFSLPYLTFSSLGWSIRRFLRVKWRHQEELWRGHSMYFPPSSQDRWTSNQRIHWRHGWLEHHHHVQEQRYHRSHQAFHTQTECDHRRFDRWRDLEGDRHLSEHQAQVAGRHRHLLEQEKPGMPPLQNPIVLRLWTAPFLQSHWVLSTRTFPPKSTASSRMKVAGENVIL